MYCLFLLFLVASVSSDSCPEVTPVKNFNFNSFANGVWYEVARYPNPSERDGECGTAEFTRKGDVVTVKNSYVKRLSHKAHTIEGTARPAVNGSDLGVVILSLPYGVKGALTDNVMYILAAEYNQYAICYYCNDKGKGNRGLEQYAWILSREKSLSSQADAAVDRFLKNSNVLDADDFLWPSFTEEACRVDKSAKTP